MNGRPVFVTYKGTRQELYKLARGHNQTSKAAYHRWLRASKPDTLPDDFFDAPYTRNQLKGGYTLNKEPVPPAVIAEHYGISPSKVRLIGEEVGRDFVD